jgi:hypothetical protein
MSQNLLNKIVYNSSTLVFLKTTLTADTNLNNLMVFADCKLSITAHVFLPKLISLTSRDFLS